MGTKDRKSARGQIFVVGIGPGSDKQMTPQAREAIEASDAVVGYTVYIDLVKELTEGKEVRATSMKQEVDRCKIAMELALQGKRVAFVCSGDPGIYGMAGIMCEVAEAHPEIEIITVPGITAASSGAALLGAPLIHDFAVISLSDLLTPMDLIRTRLDLAARADFVLVLYNPRSKKRRDHLREAVEIIGRYRSSDTPSAYVRKIGRDGETYRICALKDLAEADDIDMFTTVFIGNSSTRIINGRLVTPRGYRNV